MSFVCSICGKEYDNLNDYLNCVSSCGEKLKKEAAAKEEQERKLKEQKRLEEINAALNGVKQAKIYYESKLAEFKQRYPEEYKMNFGDISSDNSKNGTSKNIAKDTVRDTSSNNINNVDVSIIKNKDEKPVIKASVNGTEIPEKNLSNEMNKLYDQCPEVNWLAHLFGLE